MNAAQETPADAEAGNHGAEQVAAPAATAGYQHTATSAEITEDVSAGGTVSTDQLVSGSPGDAQQPADSGGLVDGQTDMNLMPAISNLVAHISQHLSSPDGNPQLALTFQPLVNMALHMQLQIQSSMPDASTVAYLSSLMAAGGAAPAAAAAVQAQAFDPQLLMGNATAAAATALEDLAEPAHGGEAQQTAAQLPEDEPGSDVAVQQVQQPQPQQQQEQQQAAVPAGQSSKRGAGRRRQQSSGGASTKDANDRHSNRLQAGPSPGTTRPQRQRKKSKLLQEYVDDEGAEHAAG